MAKDYTEDSLVEQPTIALFAELGWETANCFYESFHDSPSPLSSPTGRGSGDSPSPESSPRGRGINLGRETAYDVVLESRLRAALRRPNPGLPDEAVNFAVEEVTKDRGLMSPAQANREVYKLLKEGVKVELSDTLTPGPSPIGRGEDVVRVRVIDWDDPSNNDFFLASQIWVSGEMYKRRADLVGFVNGIPLVFVELKAFHKNLEDAFQNNLRDYKTAIPHAFWYNAFIILSNGSDSRIGTITAEWEHFAEWKKIDSEGEEGVVSLETMIRGTCEKARLLDLVENFTLFSEEKAGLIKMLAKNHQYLGVNNAINALMATLTHRPSPSGRGKEGEGKRERERGRGKEGEGKRERVLRMVAWEYSGIRRGAGRAILWFSSRKKCCGRCLEISPS